MGCPVCRAQLNSATPLRNLTAEHILDALDNSNNGAACPYKEALRSRLDNLALPSSSVAKSTMNSATFGNFKQDSVFNILRGFSREEGMSREEIHQKLRWEMTRKDVDNALEFLNGEGDI